MNRAPLFLPFFALFLAGCDQAAIKKEAYDKGFADGRAAEKAEAAKELAARATPRRMGTALDRPTTTQGPQTLGPASRLQGTALDQKPSKR